MRGTERSIEEQFRIIRDTSPAVAGQARSWERHFRWPIEPFIAEERDRVTILFGGLTWKHEKLRKQYVYGYMAFLNINICCNNTEDVRQLTEYAHAHRIATDYHINETPCWSKMNTSSNSMTTRSYPAGGLAADRQLNRVVGCKKQ